MLYSRTGIFFADQPTVVLRKFPTLEASIPDRQLARFPVYFNLGAGLSGVARRDASITTPTLVERFDLHPSVEVPVFVVATVFDELGIPKGQEIFEKLHDFSIRATARMVKNAGAISVP